MKITVNNVCNVKQANLEIKENQLNIFFGNNGLGKSSIANAIYYTVCNKTVEFERMKTFGCGEMPTIVFDTVPKDCLLFNDEYVRTYLFLERNLLDKSYELIIKTKNFDIQLASINQLLSNVKANCQTPQIAKLREQINEFKSEIQFTDDEKSLKYSSKIGKGFKNGITLINDIPKSLESYTSLLKLDINYIWMKWMNEGKQFCKDDRCPYCRHLLSKDEKANIEDILKLTTSQAMKDNNHSKEMVTAISSYSNLDNGSKINKILSLDRRPNEEETKLLKHTAELIEREVSKFDSVVLMDAISLKTLVSGASLSKELQSKKIDPNVLFSTDSSLSIEIKQYNTSIDDLINSVEELKGMLIELNKELSKNVDSAKKYLNDFCKLAGIPYSIDVIIENSMTARTVLKPLHVNKEVDSPSECLSYGEKNALSLILFSLEVKSKKPSLVILDDPVSSFDSNKKFALMHYLFERPDSTMINKTVVFLTHDLTPIIEFIKLNTYNNVASSAQLLLNNDGSIECIDISAKEINTSLQNELSMAQSPKLSIISRVCHLRRYYEVHGGFENEYQLLSSLLHCYDEPEIKSNCREFHTMEGNAVIDTTKEIAKIISDFDYHIILKQLKDNQFLISEYKTASRFEKLNIVRIYVQNNKENPSNDVCWNFIKDTYHIENLMLFGINDPKFDNIPNYIVAMCDSIMGIA